MTVLTRWDPFRELTSLQSRMSRLFEEQYGESGEEALTARSFPRWTSTKTSKVSS